MVTDGEGRIVAAALERGTAASDVAQAAGIHASQLFRWRQQLCESGPDRSAAESAPAFAAVTVATDPTATAQMPALPPPASDGVVEIELAGGARMRISRAVYPAMASALITALVRGRGGRADDPGSDRHAGVAGDRPHRHAEGLRRASSRPTRRQVPEGDPVEDALRHNLQGLDERLNPVQNWFAPPDPGIQHLASTSAPRAPSRHYYVRGCLTCCFQDAVCGTANSYGHNPCAALLKCGRTR
ncbi:hypothetical protein CH341_01085 [Rhodoplanes roseus]|uniref:Transposase n=1 Tax=Rhodoplanes roseus TaxID=29409 RepID=A0A327L4S5_9BRAD|nr:hypothetical protein CH341_01085 [Rhodoplanes roseus]